MMFLLASRALDGRAVDCARSEVDFLLKEHRGVRF